MSKTFVTALGIYTNDLSLPGTIIPCVALSCNFGLQTCALLIFRTFAWVNSSARGMSLFYSFFSSPILYPGFFHSSSLRATENWDIGLVWISRSRSANACRHVHEGSGWQKSNPVLRERLGCWRSHAIQAELRGFRYVAIFIVQRRRLLFKLQPASPFPPCVSDNARIARIIVICSHRFSSTFKDCAHDRASVSNHWVIIKQDVVFRGIISITCQQRR